MADVLLVLNPKAAEAIRLIFDWKLEGLGWFSIEKKLNAEAPWTPPAVRAGKRRGGNGWRRGYIRKIIRNRAVLGEFQPHLCTGGRNGTRTPEGEPVKGYYPAIVKPKVFDAVQKLLKVNKGKGGQTGEWNNVLRDIVKCAYCGGPAEFQDKAGTFQYLLCSDGARGVKDEHGKLRCERNSVPYQSCEDAVIQNCPQVNPELVLPTSNEQTARVKNLRIRVSGSEEQRAQTQKRLDNYLDRLGEDLSEELKKTIVSKMKELEARKQELDQELAEDRKDLMAAESVSQSFANWQRSLDGLRKALAAGELNVREKLNSHLKQFIDKIEVFARGHKKLVDPKAIARAMAKVRKLGVPLQKCQFHPEVQAAEEGEDYATEIDNLASEFSPEFTQRKGYGGFLDYVTQRRMSRDGRFLRVHFKTGRRIDLVPAGSIASGYKLVECEESNGSGSAERKKRWSKVSPDVDQLWEDFQRSDGGAIGELNSLHVVRLISRFGLDSHRTIPISGPSIRLCNRLKRQSDLDLGCPVPS